MGILLVYDVTDERSFLSIRNWIANIDQFASESVNRILVGNKCDMTTRRVIEYAAGKTLADEYGIRFLETSAKNSTNVDEAFISLARDIKKRAIDTVPAADPAAASDSVRITAGSAPDGRAKDGCGC